ncbi:E3 ubiquitin-protein ligase TRIM71-like [Mercenaria mercenaria]|uniref:E3 ubiquitin-protein ligase TRIM71-like n=1 Tax=Mercenaria mercenaria TaxID=6596 RepID=UPI00234E971D|nr:E3 ubiquitin-protein ligase TRIM71-like [Mercenaria mercenaria]
MNMATSQDYRKSVIAASDEIKDIFCEPCVGDGKQIEAEGFCVDCSEYLCGQCYNSHGRFKAFKHHVLQDKKNMPIDVTGIGVLDVCVEKCSKHPTKVTEYFCRSCDTLGCSACITTNHRQCQNVDHVPDIVIDLENNEEFKTFAGYFDKKLTVLKERKDKINSRKTELEEMKKQAKAELKKQRDEINKFFDHLENEMDKEITDIDKNNKDTLKSASDRCNIINDELYKMKTAIEKNRKNGQKCELFIKMKRSKGEIEKLDSQFKMLYEESKVQRYKLVQSAQIEEIMKNTTEICRMLTAKLVSEIDVSSSKDKGKPRITGISVVQRHYLAVTDDENKAVKITDTRNGGVISEISLDCNSVLSVTNVKSDQIIVSLICYEPMLQCNLLTLSVSASGALSKGNVIATRGSASNVVCIVQHLYLLRWDYIEVLDLHGKILRTIGLDHTILPSMAISPDKKTIYITNHDNNFVKSMTLDGKVTATYKDKDLEHPWGVTVDDEGFVYVRSKGGIHQLTKFCTKVQIILDDVIGGSITHSGTNNILYVGEMGKVKVYELK